MHITHIVSYALTLTITLKIFRNQQTCHTHVISEPIRPTITTPTRGRPEGGRSGRRGIGGVNRIGEQYYREEPTLAGRFRKVINEENKFYYQQHYHYMQSDLQVGLDALSEAKGQYYRPSNNSFVRARGIGACPYSEFMDWNIIVYQT